MIDTAGLLAGAYLALLGSKACGVWWQVRRERRTPATPVSFDVTIVQPILSGDPHLREVLTHNLRALQSAHMVWLIDTDDAVAQELAREFAAMPQLRVLTCPGAPDGVNPKTFKLDLALATIDTEFLLVLDDDARLGHDSLAAMLSALGHTQIATALPHYLPGDGWPARLLAQFVNDNAPLTYLPLLPVVAPVTINGMCYALRTRYLRDCGGFTPLLRHLTDDLAVADLVRSRGGTIAQMAVPVAMQTAVPTVSRYGRQMHRWFLFATLLLRRQSLAMNAMITVLQGLHPLLLWALCAIAACDGAGPTWLALGVVVVLRAATLAGLQLMLSGAPRHDPVISVLSELLQPLHLLHASIRRTITWRTRRYRVFDNHDFVAAP